MFTTETRSHGEDNWVFKRGGEWLGCVVYPFLSTRAKGESIERIPCCGMVTSGILGIFRLSRRMRSDFAQNDRG